MSRSIHAHSVEYTTGIFETLILLEGHIEPECRDVFANPKHDMIVHHNERNVNTCIGWARLPITRIDVSMI
jgi:hypothetical protein